MQKYEPDLGLRRDLRHRTRRRWLVTIVILLLFVELQGVPHLRVPVSMSREHGTYWSITGPRFDRVPNAPLIALLPLRRSLLDYVATLMPGRPE